MFRSLLAIALLLSPAAALAEWREASSRHFVVYSEGSEESLRDFATKLERYDKAMRFMHRLSDPELGPAARLTVYMVSNIGEVQKLYGGKRGGDLAGFYLARAGGSIAIIPRRAGSSSKFDLDPEGILLHEYAHHVIENHYQFALPGWFAEGFAEFNASARFERDGAVGLGAPALHRGYGLLTGNPLPLETMLGASYEKLTAAQIEAIYGRGWLLTHMLIFDPARKGQLGAYLTAINSGKPPIEAAQTAFGDLKQLGRDMERYLNRRRMTYFRVPPEQVAPGAVTVRTLSPAESAIMDVRIRSDRGVTREQARALVPLAREAAAPYPDSVAAQTMLAEAEYDAENYAEALAAAERALKADPKSIEAVLYKGRVQMQLAKTPEDWKAARRSLVAANRIDPNHPEPLMLFYLCFIQAGEKPTANAVVGLNQAFGLAPHDDGLRLMAARQYLIDGKADEARAALQPIAHDPHAGKMGDAIGSVLAALQAGDAGKALAVWDGLGKSAEEPAAAAGGEE